MIIDIPGTSLELEMETDGSVVLKEKDSDGYYARFIFDQHELLLVSSALLGAHITYVLAQGDTQ